MAAFPPGLIYTYEKFAPSGVGKGGFAPIMRLNGVLGLGAGFLLFYQSSLRTSPSVEIYLKSLSDLLYPSTLLRLLREQARD